MLLGAAFLSARLPLQQPPLGRPSQPCRGQPRRCLRLCVVSKKQQQQQAAQQQQQGPQVESASAEVSSVPAVSEADLYAVVSPASAPPPPAKAKIPIYVYGPLGFLALLGVGRIVGAVLRRGRARGSLSDDYRREGYANDQDYERMMRSMKTTQYEELSEEQILAARRRRMKEIARDSAPMDLDQIELPENHPFAVKKKLTPEEEALQAQRLRARRGLSEADMRALEEARRQSLAED